MIHKLYILHPGLVGAAVGFFMGARYSMWWFGSNSAEVGLSGAKTIWLLVATSAVIICFPMLLIYFAFYSYQGLQTDPRKSASDSWKIIAAIVFCLSFGYAIAFFVLIKQPTFISTATMWSLLISYAAIIAAPLYLTYKLPWVNWGRLAMKDNSAATVVGERVHFEPEAKTMGTTLRSQHQQDSTQRREER